MAKKDYSDYINLLCSRDVSTKQKASILHAIAQNDQQTALQIYTEVAQLLSNSSAAVSEELEELRQLVKELDEGPQRPATFVGTTEINGTTRAKVTMHDGSVGVLPVVNKTLIDKLRVGDEVLIDAKGLCIVSKSENDDLAKTGEEAYFIRRISPRWVELTARDGSDKVVYLVMDELKEKLDKGEVAVGSTILVCSRRSIAIDMIAPPEGVVKYRFLSKERVPDIVISRDIGNPNPMLNEVLNHVKRELVAPEVSRQYRLQRSLTRMLVGPSGTGKTLSLQGLIRGVYDLLSEHTGAPIDQIPQRVMRLRVPDVLSKWLGDSDKNLDRFFSESEELAEETFEWEGTTYKLPVIMIFEEADAIARRRGMDSDGIYDRIQTTLLQRLDATVGPLADRLMLYFFTSNLQNILDPAFIRRAGGRVIYFGRLEQDSFKDVLRKQLRDRKISHAVSGKNKIESVVDSVADWMFDGHDKGQIEVVLSNGTKRPTFRRDFLTGGLVGRAVEAASLKACEMEVEGVSHPGLNDELLIQAHEDQFNSMFDACDINNLVNFLDVPQGVRVASMRRLPQNV